MISPSLDRHSTREGNPRGGQRPAHGTSRSNHDVSGSDGEQWDNRGLVQTNRPGRRGRVVETSYVGGSGVLLARSRRWLLLDDDPPPERSTRGGTCWAPPARSAIGCSTALEERLPAARRVAGPGRPRRPGPGDHVGPRAGRDVDGGQRLTVGLDARVRPAAARRRRPGRGGLRELAAQPASGRPDRRHPRRHPGQHRLRTTAHPADVPARRRRQPARYDDLPDDVEVTVPRSHLRRPRPGLRRAVRGRRRRACRSTAPSSATTCASPPQETVLAVYCPKGHVTPAYTPDLPGLPRRMVPPQDPQRHPAPAARRPAAAHRRAGAAGPGRGLRPQAGAGRRQPRLAAPGPPAPGLDVRLPDAPADRARRLAGAGP